MVREPELSLKAKFHSCISSAAGATPGGGGLTNRSAMSRPGSAMPSVSSRKSTQRDGDRMGSTAGSRPTKGEKLHSELRAAHEQLRHVTEQKLLECWRKCELKATGGMPSYHMYRSALAQSGLSLPEETSFKLFTDLQQGWGEDSDNWNPVALSENRIDDAMQTISPMLIDLQMKGFESETPLSTARSLKSLKSSVKKSKLSHSRPGTAKDRWTRPSTGKVSVPRLSLRPSSAVLSRQSTFRSQASPQKS